MTEEQGVVYGNHMPDTIKTTVYLSAADYRRLKQLAVRLERPAAELLREAVAEYLARQMGAKRPRSIGALHSGRGDLSLRAESLLAGIRRE